MAVAVVILALLEKYSVYLCAVSAHQGHRRVNNSKEHIWNVCLLCQFCSFSFFSTNEGKRL